MGAALFATLVLALAAMAVLPSTARAATRTWTGLGITANWSEALNWSGGLVPGGADLAVFDGTSAKPATINANVSVRGISITAAYGGTVTQAAGSTLTVGSLAFTQAGATFVGGTAAMTVNGAYSLTGGSFTSTAGTLTVTGGFTVSGGTLDPNGGTVAFATSTATINPGGTLVLNNVTFVSGSKTIAAGSTLTAAGALTLTSGTLNTGSLAALGDVSAAATFSGGTGSLRLAGSTDQTLSGSATPTGGGLPNLVIDKPSGTLTLAGTLRTVRSWTYLAGGLDASGSTVVFAGGTISGSHALDTVELRGGTVSIAAGSTLTAAGALTLTSGTLNTGSLAALGDVSAAATFSGGTGSLRLAGSTDQTLSGSATPTGGGLPNLVIDKPSGTLTLAGTLRTVRSWTYLAGGLDASGSTVVFAGTLTATPTGMAFDTLTVNGGTTTLAGTLTVDGSLTVSAGTLRSAGHDVSVAGGLAVAGRVIAGSSRIEVGGDVTVTGTFTPGSSNLVLAGPGPQLLGGSVPLSLYDLSVDAAGGATLGTSLTVAGTLTLNDPLVISGQRLTISNPIGGSPALLVADATTSLWIVGSGSGIVIPSSVTSLLDLSLNNPNGAALAAPLTVDGTLGLLNGRLDAGPWSVTIGPSGAAARTSGHVIGALRKPVPAGAGVSLTYEVGDASAYAPVDVVFANVATPGRLVVTSVGGDHPSVAASPLDPARGLNRWWSLANEGIAFDSLDATFTFDPSDLDPGARIDRFAVAKLDGSWSLVGLATWTPTSLGVAGVTSMSAFAAGELATDLSASQTAVPDPAYLGQTVRFSVAATNLGPAGASAVVLEVVPPTGSTLVGVAPEQGTCAVAGGTITCDLGALAAGASALVDVDVIPGGIGPAVNQATVSGYESDVIAANDTSLLAVSVIPVPVATPSPTPGMTPSPTPSVQASPGASAGRLPDTARGTPDPGAPMATIGLWLLGGLGLLGLVLLSVRRARPGR